MAIIYEKLSKGEQAKILDYLSQSVTHSKSHHQRALVKRAQLYISQGNVISALEDASRIINNDSRNPAHYVYRAGIFEKNKQQIKAIDDYGKAIELGDYSHQTFLNKSILEFVNLRYADVINTTTQGIDKNKTYGMLYYYRGLAKDKQSSCSDAGDDFRNAMQKGIPDSAKAKIDFISNAYIAKGNAELAKGSYLNALREFGNAVAIDSNQTGLYKKGSCFLNIGILDSALILLNALLNNNTEFADAHNQRGYVYLKQKKFESALNDFDEEVKRNQLSVTALYGKGMSEFSLGKYTEAAVSFEKAGTLASSDSAWYYASLSNYNLKRYDKAIDCSNKAQKEETKKFEVYYICGRAYFEQKDYSNAVSAFSKALPLVAFDDELYLYNASANELNGSLLEASSAFDKLSISYKYKDTSFFRSGICLIKMHKPANYKNAISKLLNYGITDTSKNKGESFAWIAYAYLSIDSVKQANEFILKAKTANEQNYMTQYVVAIANTKDSMFDDAYIALEKAMQSKKFIKEEFIEEKLFKPLYKKDKFQILVNRYYK
jgi:tetratricopeptide (TPR) repeat protein